MLQTQRLLERYEDGGGAALIHRSRGRSASNRMSDGMREYVLELVRQHYRDFGPTLTAEMLEQEHNVELSRETLRKWMAGAGLWLLRKQRKSFHQLRLHANDMASWCRSPALSIAGSRTAVSPARCWSLFKDATSKLMQLRFVPSESTSSYFEALQDYLQTHGCPVAFYSDKHAIFRVNRNVALHGQITTQFGRALAELNIEILRANSSQAKGRVERANRTLQDRLKELRLAGISSMKAGNAFLPGFLERFNERFSVRPAKAEDLHRRLSVKSDRLNDILCYRDQRYIGAQLSFHYDRKQIILEQTDLAKGLAGKYVDLYDFEDRPLEVRWKDHALPYRVFEKDRRGNPAAIVANKRLRQVLAIVKAKQDRALEAKVMNTREKTGYEKKGRNVYGSAIGRDRCESSRFEPAGRRCSAPNTRTTGC